MTRLKWNQVGHRNFEAGVSHGVLFPKAGPGVSWNGLTKVDETISGGESESYYFDGNKYLDIVQAEDFEATVEAFSSPAAFDACDGTKQLSPGLFATGQRRRSFDFSYRTLLGNDLEQLTLGYKLHLVYNCMASPASRTNTTTGEKAITPMLRSWVFNAVPPPASTYKPTAHFVIDSRLVNPYMLGDLESYLYGREDHDPSMPTQPMVLDFLANAIEEPLTDPI